jgi:hypothetical protein
MSERKPKAPLDEATIEKMLDEADALLTEHAAECVDIMEDSESQRGTITIKFAVDISEPPQRIEVKLSMPRKPVKDTRALEADEPAQCKLPIVGKTPKGKPVVTSSQDTDED